MQIQSEDEEHGGRSKKGLKDKIEEKLPGGEEGEGKEHAHTTTVTSATTTDSGANHHPTTTTDHEKKSIIDKIKEKFQ